MHRVTKIPLLLLNPMLTCRLCDGYLIDATTVVECLHSFCRSCLLKHLEYHTTCPICDTLLHKTRPHYAIRSDRVLQAIVYKLIPNLFEKEMLCRRTFYKDRGAYDDVRSLSPEKRGDITLSSYVSPEEEHVSLELIFWHPEDQHPHAVPVLNVTTAKRLPGPRSTYLLCPPELTVAHLEKLIRVKFSLEPNEHKVFLFFTSDDLFNPDYTLSDLACLYAWRRVEPMRLFFTVLERSPRVTNGLTSVSPPSTDLLSLDASQTLYPNHLEPPIQALGPPAHCSSDNGLHSCPVDPVSAVNAPFETSSCRVGDPPRLASANSVGCAPVQPETQSLRTTSVVPFVQNTTSLACSPHA